MRKFIRYTLLLVNCVFALLLVLTYLAPHINPSAFWVPSLLGLLYPFIFAVNVLFVVFWVVFHWRYLFVSLIVLIAGTGIHQSFIQLFPNKTNSENGLIILSYNVGNFYSFLKDSKNGRGILDFIAERDADIICLQETKIQKTGALNPLKLKQKFPGIKHLQLAHQSSWNGPVTFSKHPIVFMGELRFKGSHNMVIYTDIKVKKDTIRVYNCHLQSYGIRTDEYSVIDTLGFEGKKLKEIKRIGSKLKRGYKQRSDQVEKLVKHIKECRYPVIVCGDFNDTPFSHTYHSLTPSLSDAFVESGSGVSTTYRGKLPPYRIDYILYSKQFKAYNYKRYNVDFSDHYPISAFLQLKK